MSSELQYPTIDQVRSNTQLYDEVTIQGFIETLKWLDQGAPEQFDGLKGKYKFDITEIIEVNTDEKNDYGHSCGTVCCIGGAVNLYRTGGNFWNARNLGLWSLESMDEVVCKLFYPIGNKKAKTAARVLRHYLYTGKVSWDVKKGKVYHVE